MLGSIGWLTFGGCHAEVTDGAVEKDERETLLLALVNRRLEDSVTSSLEVTTRNNLESITNVDDESTRLVRNIVPLLITTPNLKTRNRHREQQSCQAKVCVSMHAQTLGSLLGSLLHGAEQSVAEISLAGRAAVGLDIVPEVVVGELEDAGEEGEEAAVDRLCEVVGKGLDLVHERVEALGDPAVDVLPVGLVPVELFDTIRGTTLALEKKIVSDGWWV